MHLKVTIKNVSWPHFSWSSLISLTETRNKYTESDRRLDCCDEQEISSLQMYSFAVVLR